MDWTQSSAHKPRGHLGPSPNQNRHPSNNESLLANDIFVSLKQSYEER